MAFDIHTIVAIGLIIFAAALLQGASGFGFGLIAMGLLPLFLPIELVSLTVSLILIPLLVINLAARLKHFKWNDAKLICIGTFIGVVPGILFLVNANEAILRGTLGIILIFVGIHDFVIKHPPRWIRGKIAQSVCGLLCGALGGAFNTGGPPAIYCVYNQPWSLSQAVATLQVAFLITAITKIALGSSLGMISTPMIHIFLITLFPLVAGLFAGIALSNKIPAHAVRRGAFLFLGLLGVYFITTA